MKTLLGFMNIASLIDNATKVVSPIGELSAMAHTFERELGYYSLPQHPGYDLVAFKNLDTTTGVTFTPESGMVEQTISVVKSLIVYATFNARPYDAVVFRETVLNQFSGLVSSFDISSTMVAGDDYSLPEWVEWTSTTYGIKAKIWLSDNSFREQYSYYTVVPILPLTPVDSFFNFYETVKTTLAARAATWKNTQLEAAQGNYPPSYTRFYTFNMVNLSNKTESYPVEFPVLIYGDRGDNLDAIKDAIVTSIMAATSHTRDEWETLFPDLFKRTEFLFFPRWDRVAMPNLTDTSEMYSPIIAIHDALTLVKAKINFYTQTHIQNNSYVMTMLYKSLTCLVVAGSNNIAGKTKPWEVLPKYMVVSTDSIDFGRMDPVTQEWVGLFNDLLLLCESATEYTSIPKAYRLITRGGIKFLQLTHHNVNYMVALKSNTDLLPATVNV